MLDYWTKCDYTTGADPCLIAYEDGVCARCKEGTSRFFTKDYVLCGIEDPFFNICNLSSYDALKYPLAVTSAYLDTAFYNTTTLIKETICVATEDFGGSDDCLYSAKLTNEEKELAKVTVGCQKCSNGFT